MKHLAAFNRCLPALQQLARFPHAERAYVCRKRGLDQNDVDATQRAVLLELDRAIWNEDALQDAVEKYGVKLPELGFEKPQPGTAKETSKVVVSVAKIPPEDKVDFGNLARDGKVSRGAGPRSRQTDFLRVCQHLVEEPGLKENQACQRVNVSAGAWCYFKKAKFGSSKGRPTAQQLRDILGGNSTPDTEVSIKPAEVEAGPAISLADEGQGAIQLAPASPAATPNENVEVVRKLLRTFAIGLERLAQEMKGST